jgi:hypothetical protein
MARAELWAGDHLVVDSGTVLLSPDEETLTIRIENLNFFVSIIAVRTADPVTVERAARDRMNIKINTWQGGDLTFHFKVGSVEYMNLYLTIKVEVINAFRLIQYTFTKVRP